MPGGGISNGGEEGLGPLKPGDSDRVVDDVEKEWVGVAEAILLLIVAVRPWLSPINWGVSPRTGDGWQ